jgi:hypothetical protein
VLNVASSSIASVVKGTQHVCKDTDDASDITSSLDFNMYEAGCFDMLIGLIDKAMLELGGRNEDTIAGSTFGLWHVHSSVGWLATPVVSKPRGCCR